MQIGEHRTDSEIVTERLLSIAGISIWEGEDFYDESIAAYTNEFKAVFKKQELVRRFCKVKGRDEKVPTLLTLCLYKLGNELPDTDPESVLESWGLPARFVKRLLLHEGYNLDRDPQFEFYEYRCSLPNCNTPGRKILTGEKIAGKIKEVSKHFWCRVESKTAFGDIFALVSVKRKLPKCEYTERKEYGQSVSIFSSLPVCKMYLRKIGTLFRRELGPEIEESYNRKKNEYFLLFKAINILKVGLPEYKNTHFEGVPAAHMLYSASRQSRFESKRQFKDYLDKELGENFFF